MNTAYNLNIDSILKVRNEMQQQVIEYTKNIWKKLGQKHGPHAIAFINETALIQMERELGLHSDYRPEWLSVSKFIDDNAIYFIQCQCLCHSDKVLASHIHTNKNSCKCLKD